MRTNILTFPRWEKTSTGAGQPSAGHKQEGTGGEEDVEIGDCRVWSETAKGEERICEGKLVSELGEFEQYSGGFLTNLGVFNFLSVLARCRSINELLCFFSLREGLGNACYHSVQNLLSSSLLSRNLKIKIYRTIILPVVLYGCETWSLTLRENIG